jgi:hypothetical protein
MLEVIDGWIRHVILETMHVVFIVLASILCPVASIAG